LSAREADLASFGELLFDKRDSLSVIRKILATVRDDPTSLRALALRWIEHERARGMGASTLARRWRTLAALVGVIAKRNPPARGMTACTIGKRPRVAVRRLRPGDVAEIVRTLAAKGDHRDAAIIGLLGELAMTDRETLELRARDVAGLGCSPELAAALARTIEHAPPQGPAIRNAAGKGLSSAALYAIVEHTGTSVSALRRAAMVGG
jgi:hypothetical protein